MNPHLIVHTLLEDDPPDMGGIDPRELLNQALDDRDLADKQGKITAANADQHNTFYHRKLKYKTRNEPLQCRRNGRTKFWKSRPGEFRIPVKYGMYEYFYIDHTNAHEWSTVPNPEPA